MSRKKIWEKRKKFPGKKQIIKPKKKNIKEYKKLGLIKEGTFIGNHKGFGFVELEEEEESEPASELELEEELELVSALELEPVSSPPSDGFFSSGFSSFSVISSSCGASPSTASSFMLLLPALPKNSIFAPGTKAAAYILALPSFFAPTILPS